MTQGALLIFKPIVSNYRPVLLLPFDTKSFTAIPSYEKNLLCVYGPVGSCGFPSVFSKLCPVSNLLYWFEIVSTCFAIVYSV